MAKFYSLGAYSDDIRIPPDKTTLTLAGNNAGSIKNDPIVFQDLNKFMEQRPEDICLLLLTAIINQTFILVAQELPGEDRVMRSEWEIERKFVVTYLPEGLLETRHPVSVRQGYLASEGERHVRIRDEGGRYSMTVKQGFGLKRQDTQIALTAEQFNDLWPLTQHMRVEKSRYTIGFFGHSLIIDVFCGHLAPLVLAEVEFDNEVNSRQFLPPDFAEFEVTHRREFQNVNLARLGLPDSMAMAHAY